MKSRDALHTEYLDIQEEMRGISPKLELYKNLEARAKYLKEQLGDGVPTPVKTHGQVKKNGKLRYFSRFHKKA